MKIITIIISSIFAMNCAGKMVEFTPEEINSQVPKILICERTFEMPENEEYKKALNDVLSLADNEISIVRYIFNSGRLKKSCWNGHCSGGAAIKDNKTTYYFSLRVKDNKIIDFGGVTKYVYKDKISNKDLSKRKRIFSIHNFDNTNIIKTFVYGNLETKKYLEFYPSGKLKHCGIALSNKYYRGYWDENGNLINEIVKIKDWGKEKIIAEKRTAEFKKKSDERIQAKKDFVENHPELKKIMDEMTAIGEQGKEINKKLESNSCQESEILSMKEELKVLSNKYINCFIELRKVQKQIRLEEKEK